MLAAQAAATTNLWLQRSPDRRPQVMLLGSPHLANHNRDVTNIDVTDVTAPDRQREMAVMIDTLARFRPTRIAIEWPTSEQAKLDRRYADYRAGHTALLDSFVREPRAFTLVDPLRYLPPASRRSGCA